MGMISDELREWSDLCCHSYTSASDCKELCALADRIDAEMIELPRDMDGVPWTSHEEYFWIETIGGELVCHRLRSLALVDGSRWCVEDAEGLMYEAGAAWHERPDSLERIADELDEWCDGSDVDGDACEKPRDLAKRIRKLAKVDE